MSFVVVFCAVILAVSAQYNPYQCEATLKQKGGNFHYDLTPLYHQPSTAFDNLAQSVDGGIAYFNFCGESSAGCITPQSTVCIRTATWDYRSGGLLTTQTVKSSDDPAAKPGESFLVMYTNGDSDDCPNGVSRITKVHVFCKADADPGYFTEDVSSENCVYTFKLYSKAGCGVKKGGGGGNTFAIVVLVLLLVGFPLYFVIGFVLNKFVFKKEGEFKELLPHWVFWSSLPGLVVDGCKFIAHGFKKGDYVSV